MTNKKMNYLSKAYSTNVILKICDDKYADAISAIGSDKISVKDVLEKVHLIAALQIIENKQLPIEKLVYEIIMKKAIGYLAYTNKKFTEFKLATLNNDFRTICNDYKAVTSETNDDLCFYAIALAFGDFHSKGQNMFSLNTFILDISKAFNYLEDCEAYNADIKTLILSIKK